MKKTVSVILYGIFVLSALAGMLCAAVLYPTHAANGTSAAYFTMIVLPTVFLLAGLTGIRFRYWWILTGVLWLGLAGYLLALQETGTGSAVLLAVYLILSLAAGITGVYLRRQFSSPK